MTQITLPTKPMPYSWHRDQVARLIEDEQYLFDTVEEALLLYPPAGMHEELERRLLADKSLTRILLAVKTKERARLRRNVVKSAKDGNDKMAKIAMSDLSETAEWARLQGKPWGSLGMIGDGKDDGRVVVKLGVETMSDHELIEAENELARRKKKARALLADTSATETPTEDVEDDKIVFEDDGTADDS